MKRAHLTQKVENIPRGSCRSIKLSHPLRHALYMEKVMRNSIQWDYLRSNMRLLGAMPRPELLAKLRP